MPSVEAMRSEHTAAAVQEAIGSLKLQVRLSMFRTWAVCAVSCVNHRDTI